tara:strand:- start:1390 stop:2910 length:1521 start_codon:yes stop_codon:yes gene_type:complete
MDNPSAFSQEQVVSEPTEIEKIQNRVTNFEVGLKPAVAEAVQGVIGIGLSKGLFGVDDLEAVISIREDIKKGLISYQTTVAAAQRDMEVAQQNLMLQQQAEIEEEKNRQRTILSEERQKRKVADNRLAQMEQALADKGLFLDLDGDGVIGLKDGQVKDTLTAQEQADVQSMLSPEPAPQVEPDPNHKTSGAFKLARMMNPVEAGANGTTAEDMSPPISHDESFNEEIKAASEAFKSYNEKVDNIVAGDDTESFYDEVATVDALADLDEQETEEEYLANISSGISSEDQDVMDKIDEEQFNDSFEEPTLDIGYAPTEISRREKVLLDPLGASERSDGINAQVPQPQQVTAPFITGGNAPNLTPQVTTTPLADGVYVEHTESEMMQDELEPIPTETPVVGENDVVISTDNIKSFGEFSDLESSEPQEEEFEEVVIPNRTDLESMTKKEILNSAGNLSFTIDSKLNKSLMIDSFESQANALIEELTGSDEFVSSEEADGNDDRRDGGYF